MPRKSKKKTEMSDKPLTPDMIRDMSGIELVTAVESLVFGRFVFQESGKWFSGVKGDPSTMSPLCRLDRDLSACEESLFRPGCPMADWYWSVGRGGNGMEARLWKDVSLKPFRRVVATAVADVRKPATALCRAVCLAKLKQ